MSELFFRTLKMERSEEDATGIQRLDSDGSLILDSVLTLIRVKYNMEGNEGGNCFCWGLGCRQHDISSG